MKKLQIELNEQEQQYVKQLFVMTKDMEPEILVYIYSKETANPEPYNVDEETVFMTCQDKVIDRYLQIYMSFLLLPPTIQDKFKAALDRAGNDTRIEAIVKC